MDLPTHKWSFFPQSRFGTSVTHWTEDPNQVLILLSLCAIKGGQHCRKNPISSCRGRNTLKNSLQGNPRMAVGAASSSLYLEGQVSPLGFLMGRGKSTLSWCNCSQAFFNLCKAKSFPVQSSALLYRSSTSQMISRIWVIETNTTNYPYYYCCLPLVFTISHIPLKSTDIQPQPLLLRSWVKPFLSLVRGLCVITLDMLCQGVV